MNSVPLGKVAKINPTGNGRQASDSLCSFVPMEAVDDITGLIICKQTRLASEVSKGYTSFREGDVLFAKITPCMENGKVAIADNLKNGYGYGSTEFHVLRAGEEIIPLWIYYYLRQEGVRQHAQRHMTGSAGQQRVPTSFMEELQIPLPLPDEQRRIATILEAADNERRRRLAAMELSNKFLQDVFVQMFGDPVTNPMGWKTIKLSKLGNLDRGRSKHRPRNAPELLGGKYPLVQTGEVANAKRYIRSYSQTYSEFGLKQSKLWPQGTLCITIAANIAKTGILMFDACFPDSVVGFVPYRKSDTEFVQHWFAFVQQHLESTAPESAQKNINLEILRDLDVPVPPETLRDKFAHIVQDYERLYLKQQESARQSEHLFQTFLHRAFNGEL